MDEFEQVLKKALAREEAPPWFEARVMAAAREQARPRTFLDRMFAAGRLRWASAAVAAAMLVTFAWQQDRAAGERARGEEAKARLELALKVTSAKLQKIHKKVEMLNEAF